MGFTKDLLEMKIQVSKKAHSIFRQQLFPQMLMVLLMLISFAIPQTVIRLPLVSSLLICLFVVSSKTADLVPQTDKNTYLEKLQFMPVLLAIQMVYYNMISIFKVQQQFLLEQLMERKIDSFNRIAYISALFLQKVFFKGVD